MRSGRLPRKKAICGVRPRHARSVVQAGLSRQASEEGALLGGDGAACAARCDRGDLHLFARSRASPEDLSPQQMDELVVPYGTGAHRGPHLQVEAFYAACPEVRERPFILFIGRLQRRRDAICSFRRLPDRCGGSREALVIAGPDEEGLEPELLALASEAGHRRPGAFSRDAAAETRNGVRSTPRRSLRCHRIRRTSGSRSRKRWLAELQC